MSFLTKESPNKEIISRSITEMLNFAKHLVVEDEGSYQQIMDVYASAKKWEGLIEEIRKRMAEPARKKIAQINREADKYKAPLKEIVGVASKKGGDYFRQVQENRQREQENMRALAEIFEEEGAFIPDVKKSLPTESAIAYSVKEKKFRILDITKVPLRYLTVDEERVQMDIKCGIDAIEGIEIYEQNVVKMRRI